QSFARESGITHGDADSGFHPHTGGGGGGGGGSGQSSVHRFGIACSTFAVSFSASSLGGAALHATARPPTTAATPARPQKPIELAIPFLLRSRGVATPRGAIVAS